MCRPPERLLSSKSYKSEGGEQNCSCSYWICGMRINSAEYFVSACVVFLPGGIQIYGKLFQAAWQTAVFSTASLEWLFVLIRWCFTLASAGRLLCRWSCGVFPRCAWGCSLVQPEQIRGSFCVQGGASYPAIAAAWQSPQKFAQNQSERQV